MARTRRGVTAIIGLVLCLSVAALGDVTGQTTSASDHVPLKTNWRMYAARGTVSFSLPQCTDNALARLLPQAAEDAAQAWNRTAGRPLIAVRLAGCDGPSFQDRRNAIYAVNSLEGQRLGSHLSLMSGRDGRLLEQDIQLSWARLAEDVRTAPDGGRSVVYNVVLHEMGHALGLGHVTALAGNCNVSVMREQICEMGVRLTPTSADVAALRQIYNLSPASGHRSSSASDDDSLASYDANGNGHIDDAEFMDILDVWVQGDLSTQTFNRLLEAWAQGTPLRAQAASAPRRSVQAFRLDGRSVLTQACSPQVLSQVQDRLRRHTTGPQTYVLRIRDCHSGATSTRLIAITPH